jgi:pyrroloquinoline quinone biosynthesis protein D
MPEAAPQRPAIEAATVVRFAPHYRFRYDETRAKWLVLAPEKLFVPDEVAVEILKLVDGARAVGDIVDALAARYDAPREVIAGDVLALLQDLADKGVLRP